MTWKAKGWWTVAAASVIINGGGAVFALRHGELLHGGSHVALLAITLVLVEWFRPRSARTSAERVPTEALGDDRMELLQQSVDAIAVEVERIGEAQRFSAKLQGKQGEGSVERH